MKRGRRPATSDWGDVTRSAALLTLLLVGTLVPVSDGYAGTTRGSGRLVFVTPKDQLALMKLDGTGMRKVTRSLPRIHRPLWSPDGTRVAFARGKPGGWSPDEPLYVIGADGKHLRSVGRGHSMHWSPDGRSLLFVDVHGLNVSGSSRRPVAAGRIVVVDVRSGRRRLIGRGDFPTWSPDGRRVAFQRFQYWRGSYGSIKATALFTVRRDGSDVRVLTPTVKMAVSGLTWSPDGRTIAAFCGGVWLIDAKTGATSRPVADSSSIIEWSPDGRRLAFGSPNGELETLDVKSTHVHVLAAEKGWDDPMTDIRWSPDGKRIAFEGCDLRCVVYTVAAAGSRPRTIAPIGFVEDGFDWSRS
jgi:Tol biopolymer transport system component